MSDEPANEFNDTAWAKAVAAKARGDLCAAAMEGVDDPQAYIEASEYLALYAKTSAEIMHEAKDRIDFKTSDLPVARCYRVIFPE